MYLLALFGNFVALQQCTLNGDIIIFKKLIIIDNNFLGEIKHPISTEEVLPRHVAVFVYAPTGREHHSIGD